MIMKASILRLNHTATYYWSKKSSETNVDWMSLNCWLSQKAFHQVYHSHKMCKTNDHILFAFIRRYENESVHPSLSDRIMIKSFSHGKCTEYLFSSSIVSLIVKNKEQCFNFTSFLMSWVDSGKKLSTLFWIPWIQCLTLLSHIIHQRKAEHLFESDHSVLWLKVEIVWFRKSLTVNF